MNEPMNWNKGSNLYFIKSDEGYHVSKSWVRGVPKYQAFSPTKERLGSVVSSPHEAKEICEAHREVN